jgi:hypothetical protein
MRRMARWLVLALFAVAMLAAPSLGGEDKLYDCGKKNCSEWKPKGEKTCRSCKIVQCKKQGEDELIAGEKTQNECYDGHGNPPSDDEDQDE